MGAAETDLQAAADEKPQHRVYLDAFGVDRTEVTNAMFAQCVEAGACHERRYSPYLWGVASRTRPQYYGNPDYAAYPVIMLDGDEAAAYCRWAGRRLPSEAEWEKAARGTDERRFPWGASDPAEALARFEQVWQEKQFDVFVPVDALPEGASPYGMLNMAGNVLEWVNDWYRQNLLDFCNPEREANLELILQLTGQEAENFDALPAAAGKDEESAQEAARRKRQAPPRTNPSGPTTGVFRVLRGGSWQDRQGFDLSTTRRYWLDPAQRFPHTGFRCSKDSADAR